ncbi:hypothetical protein [Citrobacter werkmanii]|uniref:hypothetical protein n=1 Tax=Citrobacter werkmanii TaxID=67827 RepID=UPI002652A30B|nr:hypothetical protein [Citrobacter werkmanii]MDN8554940.1 hypothetical protein [Citrobacter werkmanii]
MMQNALKHLLTGVLILFFIAIIAGLAIRFAGLAVHWQETLKQARTALFIWRLCLYGLMAGLWLSLLQRWKKQKSTHLPALRKMAGWSVVLLALGELSNALQGGDVS